MNMKSNQRRSLRHGALLAALGVTVASTMPLLQSPTSAAPTPSGGSIVVNVFHDYNANGVRNTTGDTTNPAIDILVPGATVTATCLTNNGVDGVNGTGDGETYAAPVTATANGAGTYTFTNLPGTPCRVEATSIPAGYQAGPLGADNAGLVQFVDTGSTVSMGVEIPGEFCQNNPTLATTCYTFGDPINGVEANFSTMRTFPYNAFGSKYDGSATTTDTKLVPLNRLGATFGIDYSRTTRKIYASAMTKVYAGFGPGGPGAVYTVDPITGATSVLATLTAGSLPARATYAPNTSDIAIGDWLQDGQYWDLVGKTSLGDIQLTDDESTLWVVNLFDRKLYPITVATGAVGTGVSIPLATGAQTGCVSSNVRPWGLGINGTDLLVGEVCSGPAKANLRAYIYSFNPTTQVFSAAPIFEFALDYPHGYAAPWCGPTPGDGSWNPWVATNVFDGSNPNPVCAYPQPMLSDIEVDSTGAMIIALRDRFGDQAGEDIPGGTFGGGGESVIAGDILRACPVSGGWALESAGVCGGVTGASPTNNEGPGGGEYYGDNFPDATGFGGTHAEVVTGGLAQVPGFSTVTYSTFDPSIINGGDWRAGGVRQSNNATGQAVGFFELFDKCDSSGYDCPPGAGDHGTFGKANGIGDIVALCDRAPVEIGNRVWFDANANGVQDAGEPAIPGVTVTVEIDTNGDNVVDTTTTAVTDANGVWVISSDARPLGERPAVGATDDYGVTALAPGAKVTVAVPTSITYGGSTVALTAANIGGLDRIDSDTSTSTGRTATFTIAGPGVNDHTWDAGYVPNYSLGNRVWLDSNNSGTVDGSETGINGVTVNLYADSDNNGVPDGAVIATQVTSSGGYYLFTNLAAGTYIVEVVGGASTPLAGLISSSGTNASATGPFEGASTPDPDANATDSDDNGTTVSANLFRSAPVTLSNAEPTGEGATPGHTDPAVDTNSNLTVDFGFYQPLSIGNLVWNDVDNSGTVNNGESGIAGVTVNLLQNGITIATTTTNAAGNYLFTNLAPGDYVVEVVTPAGYQSSTGNGTEPAADVDANATDNDDNGTTTGSVVRSAPITLSVAGEPTGEGASGVSATDPAADSSANYTVDFGFWRPVSVGNLVWADLNDNGVVDSGEPGLAGVTVRLYAADGTTEIPVGPDGILGTADDANGGMVTDSNGNYLFSNLVPGSYIIVVEVPTGTRTSSVADSGDANDDTNNDNNGGVRSTVTATSGLITLTPGGELAVDGDSNTSSNLTVDFGVFTPAPAMTLTKYTNGCDAQSATGATGPTAACPGDDGVNNPVVAVGAAITWTYVATNTGNVTLTNMQVTDNLVAQSTIDCNGATAGNGQPFSLAAGASRTCTATGIAVAGQYANTGTLTGDGEQTPGGPDTPLTPQTDPSHYFAGEPGLAMKKYTVITDPGTITGGVLAGAPATALTGVDDADVAGGADVSANHVVADGATIWWVYSITNTGNVQLDNVDLTDDKAGVICSDLTVAAGATTWCAKQGTASLAATTAGQYGNVGSVTGEDRTTDPANPVVLGPVTDPSHYFVPTPAISITKYTNSIDADVAADRPQIDAGAAVLWTYVITNTGDWPLTSFDLTDDIEGALVTAGTPRSGVTCTLSVSTVTPLAPGQAFTCSLSGVAAKQAGGADYVNLGTVQGTPQTVEPTVDNPTGDLPKPTDNNPSGYTPLVAGIGDYVWIDANGNGVQDSGETPVQGVTVQLLDVDGNVVATTTTNAAGYYEFIDLDPGTYSLQFTAPSGYVITGQDQGGNDATDSDVNPTTGRTVPTLLTGGEFDPTWDLGLYQPASLGDTVWYDDNRNGVQDSGEPGVPSVTVILYNGSGVQVATTTTGPDGTYQFTNLPPGTYTVQFVPPTGTVLTGQDQGSNNAVDSDANPTTGMTAPVTLVSGEHNPTIDAGLVRVVAVGDYVWHDTNHNGTQDAGELPVSGITVRLLNADLSPATDASGNLIATTTTDGAGHYVFDNLLAGDYVIQFSNLPAGYEFTVPGTGGGADSNPQANGLTAVFTLALSGGDMRTVVTSDGISTATMINPTIDAGIWNPTSDSRPVTDPVTPGPTLPTTGSNVADLLLVGLLLLTAGAGVVAVAKRRRRFA